MKSITRRGFIQHSALAAGAALASSRLQAATAAPSASAGSLHIAPFRFDVTPPIGHACCGGWIKPVIDYDDPLEAIGFVLLGSGPPIVICAVDWTGILNEAHLAWRVALAEAAGTSPDRVTVHCVHQHNAPFVCFDAARLAREEKDLPEIYDVDFHRRCLDAARAAVALAIKSARPVSHVAHGSGRVDEVASNSRLARDANGRVTKMRGSSSKDPELIALPEGLIDPLLRTVAFYDRGTKVVAAHYYATHPMSYYGDGRVSSDFCGLARKRLQAAEPACTHLYFTGCAGDIGAGKYNDGSKPARAWLTDRMARGMVAAAAVLKPEPIATLEWRTQEIRPMPNPALLTGALRELMQKQPTALVSRLRPAFKLASVRRWERQDPFLLSALHLNETVLLHLPAEPFVAYQLAAQAMRAGRPVAVAAYGDNGPWYIPTKTEFAGGGYEVDHAFCAPGTEDLILSAMQRLLA